MKKSITYIMLFSSLVFSIATVYIVANKYLGITNNDLLFGLMCCMAKGQWEKPLKAIRVIMKKLEEAIDVLFHEIGIAFNDFRDELRN